MSFQWMRRALLALASVSLVLLASCGSGTIESQFNPTRAISFGDSLSDLGQTGGRYTVNDNSVNMWNFAVAFSFGLDLQASVSGGKSYATGNARIAQHPDAAGNAATPTVAEQITTFLASNTLGANDLVLVNGGISDIIFQTAAMKAGTITSAQLLDNVGQAGRDMGAQVRRLVSAGGSHVAVAGTYDLSRTPWATASGQADILAQASERFNEEMLVSIVDLGDKVLYIDSAFLFNLMTAQPTSFGMIDSVNPVCTSVDTGPGIGIGANEINSRLCTPTTIIANAIYNQYLFADKVYPTPQGHLKLGDYAFSRVRSRW